LDCGDPSPLSILAIVPRHIVAREDMSDPATRNYNLIPVPKKDLKRGR